jgi:aminoglycoside phosphotransferase (APT) family kinase protein
MKSKLREPLPRETVERIVKDSFDDKTSIKGIKQLFDGYCSLVYDLELENPNLETILKISPPPDVKLLRCEKNLLQNELKTNEFLRDNTSIPVPEIITSNFNQNILDRGYIFFQKLHGTPLNKAKRRLSKKEYEDIKETLGSYAAEIHSIKGNYFGTFHDPEKDSNKTWKDVFLQYVRDIVDDGIELEAKLPNTPEKILNIFEKNAHYLEDVKEPRLTYVDLWEGNVFIAKNNGVYYIEGIIDGDRAYWGDPYYDFVSSIALFKDIAKEKAFLKGYSRKRGEVNFTPYLQCRLHMYRAYYDLQVIVERISRQYPIIFSFLLWCYVTWHLKRVLKYINNNE